MADNINAIAGQILAPQRTLVSAAAATEAFQWKRDGANISGATSETYTVQAADILTMISVDATPTNAAGAGTTATDDVFIGPNYAAAIRNLEPIAWWPLSEASGTTVFDRSGNGRNGTSSGVTVGQTGIGDGLTAYSFDGVNDSVNAYSAGLVAAFNGDEGTLLAWARVSGAGVWTNGAAAIVAVMRADANNQAYILKNSTSNQMLFAYVAGGTAEFVTVSGSPTTWQMYCLTWSKTNDRVRAYVNGVQSGSTQTGLGTFTGALSATNTCIGTLTTTAVQPYSGSIAHAAIWDRELTAAEVLSLATV